MGKTKLPKFNYYDEFIKNVGIALQMSEILKEFVDNYEDFSARETEKRVHELENEADDNMHYILNYLVKDFLPPIDREDIILLATKIDDVIDYIDEIVINLNILNVEKLRENIYEFIEIINKLCILQKEMMEKFKSSKKYDEVNEIIIKINNIEEEGDRLYEKAIKTLFKEDNLLEIIKWEKIYTYMEDCFDSFERVADTVGEVVLKNS